MGEGGKSPKFARGGRGEPGQFFIQKGEKRGGGREKIPIKNLVEGGKTVSKGGFFATGDTPKGHFFPEKGEKTCRQR